jgi:uncharacterized protein (DUF1501 family)
LPSPPVIRVGRTLGRWFGMPDTDVAQVIPNLGRFAPPDVGFMA